MSQVQPQATMRDIRQSHGVTSQDLAKMAGVPLRIPYLMEIGCPVSQNDAAKVLQALSTLTKGQSLANAQPKVALRSL
jgi:hypothetical protein